MDEKNIDRIIDKIMEGYDEELEKNPNVRRVGARETGAQNTDQDKQKEYDDWIQGQSRSGMPIGYHKRKRKRG